MLYKNIFDWYVGDKKEFQGGIAPGETADSDCVYFKSIVQHPKGFGYMSKTVDARPFWGKRLKMSARLKTDMPKTGHAQLWLRADGNWKKSPQGCFDNMYERPVTGRTDWTTQEVEIYVPAKSTEIVLGVLIDGSYTGKIWMADVSLQAFEPDANYKVEIADEAFDWYTSSEELKAGMAPEQSVSGDCVYLKSIVPDPKEFGCISKEAAPDQFIGKRLKMSASLKTDLPKDSGAQLWLRVDGNWKRFRAECFDNMNERPVKGKTDWETYEVLVNVPKGSRKIWYGVLIHKKGQVWMKDVNLEAVESESSTKKK